VGRSLIALTVAFLCLLAAAGCGGGGESGEDGGSGTVQFLVFGEPEELRAYRDIITAFREVEPSIDVQLVEASDRSDLIARLSTSIAGGNPPDVFLLNYRFYGQFAAKGALEPIAERFEASEAFEPEDFYEEALEAFRWEGEQMCIPQNISSLVVYYNRSMFRDQGVSEPEPGWQWRDMVEKAKALTRDEDGDGQVDVYGLGVEASVIRLAPFVWSNGGEIVDDLESPTRFTLDEVNATDAMAEFFALRRVHGVIPSEEELESEDDESRFLNGRSAMVLSSRRSTPVFRTITDFDWDIAPLPILRQPAGILHSDAYCMTAGSENKDAAWRLMEFALGPEGQRIAAGTGRTVPSLKAVANSDAFLGSDAKPASSRIFLDTIPQIRRVPNISTWPEIEDATAGIFEVAMYDDLPPQLIAQQVDEATRDLFARAE
jgi:multiple sugar transport system substrate-binding protein